MKIKLYLVFILFTEMIYGQVIIRNKEPITAIYYKVDVYGGNKPKEKATTDEIGFRFWMQKMLEIGEYALYMNKNESVFTALEPPENTNISIKDEIQFQANRLSYKNIANREMINQGIIDGKYYNIIRPFEPYKWTITTETKKILGYTCYKATSTKEGLDFDDNKIMIPGPVVWFTPEIPLPFGPRGIDGLPGVILESNSHNRFYFYATKIISDKEPLVTIEMPKGEFVTEKEYGRLQAISIR
jgi:GLPGLI family protein